jgi:hypothetical protein
MSPGREIENRRQLVRVRILTRRKHRVLLGDACAKPRLKLSEFLRDSGRGHAKVSTDSNPDVFETRFTAESANIALVWNGQASHENFLPMSCQVDLWKAMPLSFREYLLKDLLKILA